MSLYSSLGSEGSPICLFDSNLISLSELRDSKSDILPNVENEFYQFTNLDSDQISISQLQEVARSIFDIDNEVRNQVHYMYHILWAIIDVRPYFGVYVGSALCKNL